MVKVANGSRHPLSDVVGGALQDSKDKTLNFKVQKGTSTPSFIARGSDGQIYGVTLDSVLVTVNVAAKPNYKQLRKQGFPVPKDKAEDIDKQLKKEKEREEKVASGEMSAEDAAKEAQEDQKREAKEEREEAEKESKEAEEATTTETATETESESETETEQTTFTGRRGRSAR